MTRAILAMFALALVGGVAGGVACAVEQDQPHGPDVVVLDQLEDEYEPVPFSHAAHAQMAQMWNGCVTCHHRTPQPEPGAAVDPHEQTDAAKVPRCETCHAPSAADAGIEVPSLKGAYHRQCLNCHKDWSGDNGCVICHAPRNGGEARPTPGDIVGRMHPPIETPVVKLFVARFMPAAGDRVTFRHTEHVQRYGIDCAHCHHRDTCADCHSDTPAPHKPVEPAMSWRDAHGPCMTCHQDQPCETCHYNDGDQPPPPFDHRLTGQLLDEDHADLTCARCHRAMDFTVQPQCGNGDCHGDKLVALPDDRPGPRVEVAGRLEAPSVQWASLRPRPLAPGQVDIDEQLAAAPRPSAIVQAAATSTPAPPRRVQLFDEAAEPVQQGDPSCTDGDCHVAVKAFANLHGPAAADACDVCHKLTDEEAHTFELTRSHKELCTYCHEFDVSNVPVVHEPVQREECLGCHNPHGGAARSLMREESVAATCGRCHDRPARSMAFQHSPVRDGQCIVCHAPHASRLPDLLDAAGADLCIACHREFGKQLAAATFTHQALDEQCARCHDPHGSDQPLSLTAPLPQLCYECHDDTYQTVTQAAFSHDSAVVDAPACMNCHTPHGGNLDDLMRGLPRDVCLGCHDQPVAAPDGHTIAAVPDVANDRLYGHGPVSDGQCGGCHQPHGSMNANLLTQPYETDRYQRFTAENYAFCFQCHDAALVVQPSSSQPPVTRFRNGSTNLHALHVNDRWGRSCSVCHRTHAGDNVKLVRATLQFKQWEAAIGFRPTETGGFCTAGCHVPLSYDRQNPVAFDARVDKQTPQAVRAAPRPPVRLDIGDVKVPDDQRPSVVIVLRPEDAADVRLIAPLIAALPDAARVNTVALVSGAKAQAAVDKLTDMHTAWRVAPDADGELSKALDVHGWPMVLLVDESGVELARLSGAPISLAIRLQGYLDARRDQQDAAAMPAVTVVDDGQQRRVDQYLPLVEQLRRQGDLPRAQKVLHEALQLHPDATALRLALIGTLIDLGRAEEALGRLAALPDAVRQIDEARLLQARAMVALDRWDEARTLAEAVVEGNGGNREALLLLGRIHEHAGRWRQAAEAYRRAQQP